MNEHKHYQARTVHEIEEIVTLLRLHFYNRGQCCGANVIQHHMKELHVKPLPSVTSIKRILKRRGLTHGRTGIYEEDCIGETHNIAQRPSNNLFAQQKKRLDINQNKE